MTQKKLPLINSAHGSETRNIINELIKLFNQMGHTYDESLQKAHDILDEAKQANKMNVSVQQQINAIISDLEESAVTVPELSQARFDAEGNEYDVLKERLDEENKKINNDLKDTTHLTMKGGSFVDKLMAGITVHSMYVRKTERGVNLGVNLKNEENSSIEYRFVYNDDNLLLLRGVRTGSFTYDLSGFDVTLEGSFNTTSPYYTYTTNKGDSFTFTFTGSDLEFERRMEERGGLWEFRTDKGDVSYVTCYHPSSIALVWTSVFSDLPHDTYNVTATFLGQDPNYPVSNARGYLNLNRAVRVPVNKQKPVMDTSKSNRVLIAENSIPDFAISARPEGAAYSSVWVPQHGNVTGVSVEPRIKLLVNGEVKIIASGETLEEDYIYDVESFELIQSFGAYHPNNPNIKMWDHFVGHTMTAKEPCLKIQNRMVFTEDTRLSQPYLTMLPVDSRNVGRLALNNGWEISPIPTDDTNEYFDKNVTSALFSGEYSPGFSHSAAIDVASYGEAINSVNKLNGTNETPCRLSFRSDNVAKFYLLGHVGTANSGEIFRNEQRIMCVSGVRYPNTLQRMI